MKKTFFGPFFLFRPKTVQSRGPVRLASFRQKSAFSHSSNVAQYKGGGQSTSFLRPMFSRSKGPVPSVESINFHKENDLYYGKFHLSGFQKGQALTVANSLRRILLNDLQGFGITHLKFSNRFSPTEKYHEFSTIPGVRESLLELVANFKSIIWARNTQGQGSSEPTEPRSPDAFQSLAGEGILHTQERQRFGDDKESSVLSIDGGVQSRPKHSFFSGQLILLSLFLDESLTLLEDRTNEEGVFHTFTFQAKHLKIPEKSDFVIVNPNLYLATFIFSKTDLQFITELKKRKISSSYANESLSEPTHPTKTMFQATESIQDLSSFLGLCIEYFVGTSTLLSERSQESNVRTGAAWYGDSDGFFSQFGIPILSNSSGMKPSILEEPVQINILKTDCLFSPVKKVNYTIQSSYETSGLLLKKNLPKIKQNERQTKQVSSEKNSSQQPGGERNQGFLDDTFETKSEEDIFLEIWTNGSLHPQMALQLSFDFFLQMFKELRFSLHKTTGLHNEVLF